MIKIAIVDLQIKVNPKREDFTKFSHSKKVYNKKTAIKENF